MGALLGNAESSAAQQNPVTAIDVALEPDATMIEHAKANNARLLKAYPNGFALDATHNPHITLLQQFVRTAELDKVYAAADKFGRREPDELEIEGVQVLLHPDTAGRSCGHRHRADRRSTQVAAKNNRRARALRCENRDRRGVHEHRRRPRHSGTFDRLRGRFRGDRIGEEIQSACYDWRAPKPT